MALLPEALVGPTCRAARPPHSAELPKDSVSPAYRIRQMGAALVWEAVRSEVKTCPSFCYTPVFHLSLD